MSELNEKLLQLKGYSYKLWHYQLSHSVVTFRGDHPDKNHHNVEVTFGMVNYFQFPSGWTGDFYLASDSELLEIMARTGMTDLDKRLPMEEIRRHFHLYKADSPHSTIYILGYLSQIEYDVEPIYN